MQNKRVVLSGAEARMKLKKGADFLADIVGATLGPKGQNVIIGIKGGNPVITNDGVSIAKEVHLKDEIEDLGARAVREASMKTNERVGDGTTTAVVLTQAILNEALDIDEKSFVKPTSAIQKKNEILEACEVVIAALDKMAKPIKTEAELIQIAKVSVESDDLGERIGKIMWELGKEGVINVEEHQGLDIEIERVEGVRLENGWAKVDFVTNEKYESVLNNPRVIVTSNEIIDPRDVAELMVSIINDGCKDVVFVARAFSPDVLATFYHNWKPGTIRVLPVNAPYVQMFNVLKDLAATTGATYIDMELLKPKEIKLEHLGSVDKVISTREETYFIGCKGDMKKRVDQIKKDAKSEKIEHEKRWLEKRVANLTGGMALIKVGAMSDQERKYLKDKIDDAVHATKAAWQEGVVAGGGLALKEVSEKLEKNILTESLKAPWKKIQENAGGKLDIPKHVIDPVKVTKTALRNACSVAGTLSTAAAAINAEFPKDCHCSKSE